MAKRNNSWEIKDKMKNFIFFCLNTEFNYKKVNQTIEKKIICMIIIFLKGSNKNDRNIAGNKKIWKFKPYQTGQARCLNPSNL